MANGNYLPYMATQVLIHVCATGFGNSYAVTLRATQQRRTAEGPFVGGISLDTESRQAEHAAELYVTMMHCAQDTCEKEQRTLSPLFRGS